ncbi:MAG TPA: lytic transglycosylase domain-containing protein [Dongiaceae bacterium]|nr:lytic transglycosylase domain-containing protein [Dongiaceae bacterium]
MRARAVTLCAALMSAGTSWASCWEAAGQRYGVDPRLLVAIAKVESDFDAGAVNRSHEHHTGSVDLGLMQINSRWLPTLARYGITREGLLEPCTSVMVGAWILADLFARHGITWEAVGAYNAACTALAREACAARRHAYAAKVHAVLAGGPQGVRAPSVERAHARAKPAGMLSVRIEDAAQGADLPAREAAAPRTRMEKGDG